MCYCNYTLQKGCLKSEVIVLFHYLTALKYFHFQTSLTLSPGEMLKVTGSLRALIIPQKIALSGPTKPREAELPATAIPAIANHIQLSHESIKELRLN